MREYEATGRLDFRGDFASASLKRAVPGQPGRRERHFRGDFASASLKHPFPSRYEYLSFIFPRRFCLGLIEAGLDPAKVTGLWLFPRRFCLGLIEASPLAPEPLHLGLLHPSLLARRLGQVEQCLSRNLKAPAQIHYATAGN